MWKELRMPWVIVLGLGRVVGINAQFRSLFFLVSISIWDPNLSFI